MDLSPLVRLLLVAALILINGFFVATEFALVSSRPTRIDQLAAQGNRTAKLVQAAKANPTRFISGTQLGVTVASLLLGWVGESAVASVIVGPIQSLLALLASAFSLTWLDPAQGAVITAGGIGSVLALAVITFFEIVLGEQVPKILALQKAETVILLTAPPVNALAWLLRPFISLLYLFTNLVLRALGLEYSGEEQSLHSPEELQLLVRRAAGAGLMTAGERDLVDRAFNFSDLTAGEVMVPRTEMVGISVDTSVQEAIRLALRHRYSRYPIYQTTIDNVIGTLSAKDLLATAARRGPRPAAADPPLNRLMRPPAIVPESAPVSEVLARLKAARQPVAIVLDEFGGTAGMVTLKDLMARLIGEVGDEYTAPAHEIRQLPDGTVLVDGLALVEDVNNRLSAHLDASEVDTMGGLVFARLGRRPHINDEVDVGSGYAARVERLDNLRIARVRLIPNRLQPAAVTTETPRSQEDGLPSASH